MHTGHVTMKARESEASVAWIAYRVDFLEVHTSLRELQRVLRDTLAQLVSIITDKFVLNFQ